MRFVCGYILIILTFTAQSQNKFDFPDEADQLISINNFDYQVFESTILVLINLDRKKMNRSRIEERQVLKRAAYDQSSFMAEFNSMEQDDPGERAILYGGTKNVSEILGKVSVKEGQAIQSYKNVASELVSKWLEVDKTQAFLRDPQYFYSGISATLSEDGKKIYVAVMYGSDASFSVDLSVLGALYISDKSYGLYDYDPKICKKTDKVEDLYQWANGLYIDKGIVYLELNDDKSVKRLLKNSDDGLAVDIVQRGQFTCDSINIVDYKKPYKGTMLKRLYTDDLMNANIVAEGKTSRFVVALGELPPLHDSVFELNLIVIQQRHICENIKKSYIEIAPLRYFFKGQYSYFTDPGYPDDQLPGYEDTDKEFNALMCGRSSNRWYKNDQNEFNCLLSSFMLSGIKSIVDHSNLMVTSNDLISKRSIPESMLHQLQIHASVKALEVKSLTKHEEKQLIEYLKEQDYSHESVENVYAIAQLLINYGEFRPALKILDPYVKNESFDEELLFSHITLSSLYQDRILSNLYASELEIAKLRNKERYCRLFTEKFSFQLFENKRIKELVCTTCFADIEK